ncbi:MAG: HAD-IIIA family hydrolase [Bacteroidales bacterium]|nr:HAD-IIIA family hydrolase [Bacteroidales bacterium]
MNSERNINRDWCLFLDRDGVINKKINNGYVLSVYDLDFIPGALEAISILTGKFRHIFIVTNQQCIGKGLITHAEVDKIHNYLAEKVKEAGGNITDIFVAPSLEEDKNPYRKPGTGMAMDAAGKYPSADLEKSVMAGDSLTDMLFGRKAGMLNVLINPGIITDKSLFDYRYNNLLDFAHSLD